MVNVVQFRFDEANVNPKAEENATNMDSLNFKSSQYALALEIVHVNPVSVSSWPVTIR